MIALHRHEDYDNQHGFIQVFFLEGGNVDACKGCMRRSVHPLDCNEILDILYSAKSSRVFSFVKFANFPPFAKIFQ